jgi:excisionase family DNA binding protein
MGRPRCTQRLGRVRSDELEDKFASSSRHAHLPSDPAPGSRRYRLGRRQGRPAAAGHRTHASRSTNGHLPPILATAREAAAILRVGRNQLYRAVSRGELGSIRIGRSIRIPKQALLDLLASASLPPASGNE